MPHTPVGRTVYSQFTIAPLAALKCTSYLILELLAQQFKLSSISLLVCKPKALFSIRDALINKVDDLKQAEYHLGAVFGRTENRPTGASLRWLVGPGYSSTTLAEGYEKAPKKLYNLEHSPKAFFI